MRRAALTAAVALLCGCSKTAVENWCRQTVGVAECTATADCCPGLACRTGYCVPEGLLCMPPDGGCVTQEICCSGICDNTSYVCGCIADTNSCVDDRDCCSGRCLDVSDAGFRTCER